MKAYRCDQCGAVHNTEKAKIVVMFDHTIPMSYTTMGTSGLSIIRTEKQFDSWRCVQKFAKEQYEKELSRG